MKARRDLLLLGAAAGLVVVANALAISLVAYNRGAEPDSVLRLGPRELSLPRSSAIADEDLPTLRPKWRFEAGGLAPVPGDRSPTWLDEAKLRELGAELPAAGEAGKTQRRRLAASFISLDALIVLELDGDAYRQSVADSRERAERSAAALAAHPQDDKLRRQAEQADMALAEEVGEASRLFAIDAGLDAGTLRARYADRAHHAIVRGRIVASLAGEPEQRRIVALVEDTGIDSVSIPVEHRSALERLQRAGAEGVVEVAIGRRLEPWIRAVTLKP